MNKDQFLELMQLVHDIAEEVSLSPTDKDIFCSADSVLFELGEDVISWYGVSHYGGGECEFHHTRIPIDVLFDTAARQEFIKKAIRREDARKKAAQELAAADAQRKAAYERKEYERLKAKYGS